MNKIIVAVLSCLLCQSLFAMPARVKYIIDGDTFVADILLKNEIQVKSVSVRLRNVDTPEIHGKCDLEIKRAYEAKQRLAELVPVGSIIEITNIKNDKYAGRIDANVFDKNGDDVGLVLIKEKYGRAYSGGKREPWCNEK